MNAENRKKKNGDKKGRKKKKKTTRNEVRINHSPTPPPPSRRAYNWVEKVYRAVAAPRGNRGGRGHARAGRLDARSTAHARVLIIGAILRVCVCVCACMRV